MAAHGTDDEAQVRHAELCRLISFWHGQRHGTALPAWRRFEPEDLLPWMGHLVLLRVAATPPRYVVRVFGTQVAAYAGRDITGCDLDAVLPEHAKATIMSPIDRCADERRIVYDLTHLPLTGATTYRLHRLFLPFARDGQRVDHILEGVYLEAAAVAAVADDPALTDAGAALP